MDFKDSIKQLGERIPKLREQVSTEEATKNAFVMPFIQALGYDIFNPLEVIPEYICDIGTKKGEKVDYAIFRDGIPVILIECKHHTKKLDPHDGQLLRYFHVSKAKFAILTNGVQYRFYTDLANPNIMDDKPFIEFAMPEITDGQIEELKKFHKSYFDIPTILATASELKYTSELKFIIHADMKNPSDAYIKYLIGCIYQGRLTDKVVAQFSDIVKRSVHITINEIITARFQSAIANDGTVRIEAPQETPTEEPVSKVNTTEDEVEAYMIVRAILRQKVDISRVTYRDAQSYFTVVLDDNNRKPICRFYFNTAKKYIGLFDTDKKETKVEISSLTDIYQHADAVLATLDSY